MLSRATSGNYGDNISVQYFFLEHHVAFFGATYGTKYGFFRRIQLLKLRKMVNTTIVFPTQPLTFKIKDWCISKVSVIESDKCAKTQDTRKDCKPSEHQ